MVIYLHGLNGNPNGRFSIELRCRLGEDIGIFVAPTLDFASPRRCYEQLLELAEGSAQDVVVVGRSLGGLLALALSQELALPRVLVNPVVDLARQGRPVRSALGDKATDELASLADEKSALDRSGLPTSLILATRDEVTDAAVTIEHFGDRAKVTWIVGDHDLSGRAAVDAASVAARDATFMMNQVAL